MAGVVTTTVTHPLDLIKIRLQLLRHSSLRPFELVQLVLSGIGNDAKKAAMQLFRKHSMTYCYVQQWYRGVGPNLLGNSLAWSVYFTLYAEYKGILTGYNGSISYFGASALAGITTSVMTNPIWVLKTCILGTSRGSQASYKNMADGVRRIYKEEGITAFWRGTFTSFFQVIQASVQFSIYDQLKDLIVTNSFSPKNSSELSTWQYIYASTISKSASMCLLYPTQVVRSRLQAQSDGSEARTVVGICESLWQNEGRFRGFYRGMGVNMLRVLPSTCITFVTYETVKKQLII